MKDPAIYFLTNRPHGTIYTGVTSDLAHRMMAHVDEIFPGYSKRHKLKRLVYYEHFDEMQDAIVREKRLKNWNRAWKVRLIQQANPEWINLFDAARCEIAPLPRDDGVAREPFRAFRWERSP